MELQNGARLGPYEIVGRLGAGGMGEVYRARDTRLERSVAIKVLPSALASDPQLRLRFEREAKAISQLNHPHICTLHDIGDGYLVMELLEGETLAARVGRGPMPPADVFRFGAQICDALHRAHRSGIVHRDLKPANIMITKAGAKLLDFGLAKPAALKIGDDETTMQGAPITAQGTILGTFHYMAPEQLEGLEADARTDIFALGAVLYEMATGRRAFDGSTRTSVIAAIVSGQPAPISSIQPLVPAALEHVVAKCLEKDPDDRWQSAHDVAEHLRFLTSSSGITQPRPLEPSSGRRRTRNTLLAAAAIVLAALLGAVAGRLAGRPEELVPSISYISFSGRDLHPAASPDGKSVAFMSDRDGKARIWLKQLSGGSEVALTKGLDSLPRFSPDGSFILFTRGQARGGVANALFRVSVLGGEVQKLIDNAQDGEWSPDGKSIAFTRVVDDADAVKFVVVLADASGGNEKTLFTSSGRTVASPRFSPDGRTLAVSLYASVANVSGSIVLIGIDKGSSRMINVAGTPSSIVWLSNDEIVYGHIRSVTNSQSAPGEIVRRRIDGEEERIVSLPTLDVSLDRIGEDQLVVETPARRSHLRRTALRGNASATWLTRGNSIDRQPSISPDGKSVVFCSDRNGSLDLWNLSLETGAMRRVTDDPKQDWDPQFTPDGKHILFSSDRSGHFEIWRANADGSYPTQVSNDGFDAENPVQAANGNIYYSSQNPQKLGLWEIRPDGKSRRIVTATLFQPEVSPDGEYVTYHAIGETDISYVVRLRDAKIMKFADHYGQSYGVYAFGRSRWLPDGKAIAFVGEDDEGRVGIYLQDFEFGRDTSSTRRALAGFNSDSPIESFGISADGTALITSHVEDVNTLALIEGLGFPPQEKRGNSN